MTTRTGGCACGTVRYEATGGGPSFDACHCATCRRWVGGPFLAMGVETIRFVEGEHEVHVWASSEWGHRLSCRTCGGALAFRMADGSGEPHLAVGTLDDASGLTLGLEIYVDRKPEGYGFLSQTSRKMTEAEFLAMIGAA